MAKRRKRRGHFCWCCTQILPNERFSGRGHADHLCKDCSKLPREERAYRQEVRNIDRMLDWNGRAHRRQRESFARMLAHPNERVRRYAESVAATIARERELWHSGADELLAAEEHAWLAGFDPSEPELGQPDAKAAHRMVGTAFHGVRPCPQGSHRSQPRSWSS